MPFIGLVFKKKKGKNWLQYIFNLVGGNAYSWKLKHNIAHHAHTNIEGKDFDTDLSPLMRLSPKSPYRKQYRWQHLSVFLIYPMLSLLVVLVGDFKILFQSRNAGLVKRHPDKEWILLIATKNILCFSDICYSFLLREFFLPRNIHGLFQFSDNKWNHHCTGFYAFALFSRFPLLQ